MGHYPIVLTLHLLAALVFIGAVFFEVLILESALKRLPLRTRHTVHMAIAGQARRIIPWVLLVLYGSGATMAYSYWGALSQPLHSRFGLLLAIKIVLTLSVFGHFVRAMTWRSSGRLTARRFAALHLSLFFHMLGIVLIAKFMFHAG